VRLWHFSKNRSGCLTTSSTSVSKSVVPGAKIIPNADPSIANEEKYRQNILIGSLGNAGSSDVYVQASRCSSGLDNSALKTCNLFEALLEKCFKELITNLQFITKALDNPLSLSETGLASWLSGCPNPAMSLFKNINVLPIGHRVEVPATLQTSQLKFWDIDP
jgi:hypothetical protein